MPVLALPDLHLPEAGVYLAAVMFYPRDPARHEAIMRATKNSAMRRIVERRGGACGIRPEAQPFFLDAAMGATLNEEIGKTPGHLVDASGCPRDQIAGLILTYVIACADAADPSEPATLGHAIKMIEKAGGTRGSGRGQSRTSLFDLWRDFSPAAHLSAARLFFPNLWADQNHGGAPLANLLGHAERLRIRGENHRTPRSDTSLLDGSETWRLPSWLFLPEFDPAPLPHPREIRAVLPELLKTADTFD